MTRDSLSFKLRKLLKLECKRVLCHDPYWADGESVSLEKAMAEADVLFVGTPHKAYRGLVVPENKIVVDVWNVVAPKAG